MAPEQLPLAAQPGACLRRREPTTRQLALDHDQLAALAPDRIGPHQAGLVIAGICQARLEESVDRSHAPS